MLSLTALKLLNELRLRGTLTAAAEAMHLSRSAASHQLTTLQRAVGIALTERVGRTLRFTEAGALLADHAVRVLDEIEMAESIAERVGGTPTGLVQLGAVQTIAITVIPALLIELTQAYPTLRIECRSISSEDGAAAIETGALDLAVVGSYDACPVKGPRGVHRETLFRDPVRLAVPDRHHLAHRPGPVQLVELSSERWISGEAGLNFDQLVHFACRQAGFVPDVAHHSGDYAVIAAMVAAGHGVALVPAAADLAAWPAVVTREIDARDTGRDIVALARDSSLHRPAIQAVLAALRRYELPRLNKPLARGR